ncbi:hypothetical protein D7Y13_07840 [Corallococcus praedator]|uniref:Uncharacterized protein n=1 Tax=Corallococcus praedator TaxID=2316724 RepID=A0ABX9QN62_9BACT|nr:hypothetical protein D7X75_03460 [Corallococcus sp. CA031C]RKI13338.1 hypothetical protein D7Y13_07840 [Corallococcus praedator]
MRWGRVLLLVETNFARIGRADILIVLLRQVRLNLNVTIVLFGGRLRPTEMKQQPLLFSFKAGNLTAKLL